MDSKETEHITNIDGPRLPRIAQVTERDRHLMALLATARYLSGEQISKAMFGGREEATRKRLVALSRTSNGDAPTFLRRIFFRTFEGRRVAVWTLTEAGHSIAERVLSQAKRHQDDVSVGFLEHTVTLNELLVQLLVRSGGASKRASSTSVPCPRDFHKISAQAFRWLPSDCAKLPWTQYEAEAQETRQRVIQPDAVLELPSLRRRIFIECEMGTQSVVAESDDKRGATLAKVNRYEAFLTGLADAPNKVTFYGKTYTDDFIPELLFLVCSQSRANTISAAVTNWRRLGPNRRTSIHAQTVDIASGEILQALGVAPKALPSSESARTNIVLPGALRPPELETLKKFYLATYTHFKTMRDEARARHIPVPDYPHGTSELSAVLERLGLLKTRTP